jgi:surfactin synthase thioesterase subunit
VTTRATTPGAAGTASRWVVRFQPRPAARLRLFCLPYAGSGASVYHGWSGGLPAAVEVCALQLPGREGRYHEPLLTEVGALVGPLRDGIVPFLDRPFALFGHSLGAAIAYETALALVRGGGPTPAALLVSGHRAPGLPRTHAPIHHLPDREFLEELRRLNGTPAEVFNDADLLDLVLPQLRADLQMAETYTASADRPRLSCPVLALGAMEDERATSAHLEPWRDVTTGPFRVVMFPGDHFYVNTHRTALLKMVAGQLDALLQ